MKVGGDGDGVVYLNRFKSKVFVNLFVFLLPVLLSTFLNPRPSSAANGALFEEIFIRGSGKPKAEYRNFDAVVGQGLLVIYSGDRDGGNRISSAEVYLNGNLIIGPNYFNQDVGTIIKPIFLNEDNSLKVKLMSAPGSFIHLKIFNEPAFYTDPDPESIISDENGSSYPINQVILDLVDDATASDADKLASMFGGMIVGYAPSINYFLIVFPITTKEELQNIIDVLKGNSKTEVVLKNYRLELFSVNTDLSNLKSCGTECPPYKAIQPYEKIQILTAYEAIENNKPESLYHVNIGIIDQGYLWKNHPEFNGVPLDSNISVAHIFLGDHPTKIAGIIGAKNDALMNVCTTPNFLQMNGVMGGVDDISYVLKVRSEIWLGAIVPRIENLAGQFTSDENDDVQVINISLGEGFPFFEDLEVVKSSLRDIMQYYEDDILFVIAAGNSGIDTKDTVPANIELANVITVAATDLDDKRALWPRDFPLPDAESNFGDVVDLAAPGAAIYTIKNYTDPLDANDYICDNGTSFAAPMVTGVAAILLAIDPYLSPADVKDIITRNADPLYTEDEDELQKTLGSACDDGREDFRGCRLNACKAICSILDCQSSCLPTGMLTATPSSGPGPNLLVSLEAEITSGAFAPTTNFTFWWNCDDPGTDVSAVTAVCGNPNNALIGAKFDSQPQTSYTKSHTYVNNSTTVQATFHPKVIIEHGPSAIEDRDTVTVDPAPNPVFCTPGIAKATPGASRSFSAQGGSGNYTWVISDSSCFPSTGTGDTYSVFCNTIGNRIITVDDDDPNTATLNSCMLQVITPGFGEF